MLADMPLSASSQLPSTSLIQAQIFDINVKTAYIHIVELAGRKIVFCLHIIRKSQSIVYISCRECCAELMLRVAICI